MATLSQFVLGTLRDAAPGVYAETGQDQCQVWGVSAARRVGALAAAVEQRESDATVTSGTMEVGTTSVGRIDVIMNFDDPELVRDNPDVHGGLISEGSLWALSSSESAD